MPFQINKKLWTIAFYTWIAAIILMTSISLSPELKRQNEGGFRFDYLEHFLVFAFIPILYHFARGAYLNRVLRSGWTVFLVGIGFCFLAEFQQHLIPGRSFNPIDLLLNILGYLTAGGAAWLFYNRRRKKNNCNYSGRLEPDIDFN